MTIVSILEFLFPQALIESVGGIYNFEMLLFSIIVIGVFGYISFYMWRFASKKIKEDTLKHEQKNIKE